MNKVRLEKGKDDRLERVAKPGDIFKYTRSDGTEELYIIARAARMTDLLISLDIGYRWTQNLYNYTIAQIEKEMGMCYVGDCEIVVKPIE